MGRTVGGLVLGNGDHGTHIISGGTPGRQFPDGDSAHPLVWKYEFNWEWGHEYPGDRDGKEEV